IQLIQRRYAGRLDQDADEFIGYAIKGVKRMQALIDDLLVYSRVSSRKQPLALTDMNVVVESALANLEAARQDAGAQIKVDAMPEVVCDASQMVQLLQNLIGNALKFVGKNPPVIEVRCEELHDSWKFWVIDNGIGIPE